MDHQKPHFIFTSVSLLFICTVLCSSTCKHASQTTSIHHFPAPHGYVNDFAGILTSVQTRTLDSMISVYKARTTNEIVVVTIDSLPKEQSVPGYTIALSNAWGVGDKKKDNGLTLLFCISCREMFMATGTGTEKILTDAICQQIVDNTIIPEFKAGNYYAGIKAGLMDAMQKWSPE